MRIAVLLLLVGSVAAQQAQFETKFKNIVTDYLAGNTPKAMTLVAGDVWTCTMTMEDMVSHLMKEIMGLIPSNKYLSGLGMLTTFQNCLKNAGSSMEKGMANVGAAFKAKLTPLYKTVTTKVCTMKKNGKTQAQALTEGFKLATAGLTKPLVQQIIYTCMKSSTPAEYACAVPPLKTILKVALYDINYDAAKG